MINDKGNYGLESFDTDCFNESFDRGEIDEELNNLVEHLFDGGSHFQIDDENDFNDDGNVRLEVGDETYIEIPDLRDKIDTDPDESTYYVLVDRDNSTFCWVVAEPCGTVFRG